jgi:hypothetical protein
MRRHLLAVAFVALALGAVTATGAFTGGDEAVADVYLNPAPTVEGAEYASFDGNGTLQVEITDLNDDALTDFEEVFNVTATKSTAVWIEHNGTGLTLYRSDTGASIEGSDQAVQLAADQSVPVGVRVDTRTSSTSVGSIEIHAAGDRSTDNTPRNTTSTRTPTPTQTPDNGSSTPITTTGPAPPTDGSGPANAAADHDAGAVERREWPECKRPWSIPAS